MDKILTARGCASLLGIIFIAFLLIGGRTIYSAEVPAAASEDGTTAKIYTGEPRDILICDQGSPKYAKAALDKAVAFWGEHGQHFKTPQVISCGTLNDGKLCDGPDESKMPCQPGAVVVTLFDGVVDDSHGEETRTILDAEGNVLSSTIFFPSEIPTSEEDGVFYPKDVASIIAAHALGHASGYGHVQTPLGCGVSLNPKTGHIMNPEIKSMGWDAEGLPGE